MGKQISNGHPSKKSRFQPDHIKFEKTNEKFNLNRKEMKIQPKEK